MSIESKKIVDAICEGSPLQVSEAFDGFMKTACLKRLVEIQEQIGKTLFNEKVEPDFDTAIDFVLETLEEKGPEELKETIKVAGQRYNVNPQDILEYLKGTFDPKHEYQPIAEHVLDGLVDLVEQGGEATIEFPNNTAQVITEQDSLVILNLWENLDFEHKRIMEEALTENVGRFNKVLEFAYAFMEIE